MDLEVVLWVLDGFGRSGEVIRWFVVFHVDVVADDVVEMGVLDDC